MTHINYIRKTILKKLQIYTLADTIISCQTLHSRWRQGAECRTDIMRLFCENAFQKNLPLTGLAASTCR
jgi:hypothetical protein